MNRRRSAVSLPSLAMLVLVAAIIAVFVHRLSRIEPDRERRDVADPKTGIENLSLGVAVTMNPAEQPDVTDVIAGPRCPEDPVEALMVLDELTLACHSEAIRSFEPFLVHEDAWVRRAAVQSLMVIGDPKGALLLRRAADLAPSVNDEHFMLEAADYLDSPSRDSQVNERIPEDLLPRSDEVERPGRVNEAP